MSHPHGAYLGGIRTVEDLRQRCCIDDDTGCWHWGGATSNGLPIMRIPALGRSTTSGAAICMLVTGKTPAPGVFWYRRCQSRDCVNPDHRVIGNKSRTMKARKFKHSAQTKAALSLSRRRVPEEVIEAIRTSDDSPQEAAERHGVHLSYVYRVRRGESRRPVVSSVFQWRA